MEFLSAWGYWGLLIGSFFAATIIPFSAEFLIVGLLLAHGNPWLCLVAATLGNWLGGLTTYGIGHLGKWQWIEKWTGITPEKLEKQKHVIDKWGIWIALFTWVPLIGDVFALGLGFYRINFPKTAIFMLIGKTLRFFVWIGLYLLTFAQN